MNRFVAAVSTGIVAIACSASVVAGVQATSGPVGRPAVVSTMSSSTPVQVADAVCIELSPNGEVIECTR